MLISMISKNKKYRAVILSSIAGPATILILGSFVYKSIEQARLKTAGWGWWLFPLLLIPVFLILKTLTFLMLMFPIIVLFVWYFVLNAYYASKQIFRSQLTSFSSIALTILLFAAITNVMLYFEISDPLVWQLTLILLASPIGHLTTFYLTNINRTLSFHTKRYTLLLSILLLLDLDVWMIFGLNG